MAVLGARYVRNSDRVASGQLLSDRVIEAAPPWLVSLIVHLAILILLALFLLPIRSRDSLVMRINYAEDLGDQLEVLVDDPAPQPATEPEAAFTPLEQPQLEDLLAQPPSLPPVPAGNRSHGTLDVPKIGLALTGRNPGMKQALLSAYGGNATTEAAVALGLEWLKRNQRSNGTWRLTGPYRDGSRSENVTAATAMALLAFLGAGHTPDRGEHAAVVDRGVQALLHMQQSDGDFWRVADRNHRLYSQAQATIAICELYGMTRDDQYRRPAQLAVDYAVRHQDTLGGWRYTPGSDSDLSVTGWFVMALESAMMAGLEVPSLTLERVSEYLDSVARDEGARYAYRPEREATPAMTAEGLLCRQYLGWPREDDRLVRGVEYLRQYPIDYSDANVYYWYYAAQVMHHMQGDAWEEWNRVMRQAVPEKQTKTGPERGSWHPAADRWGSWTGGRLYTTCLSIYMLEVYYRHLPLYSHGVEK